jgi:hypothetical protein
VSLSDQIVVYLEPDGRSGITFPSHRSLNFKKLHASLSQTRGEHIRNTSIALLFAVSFYLVCISIAIFHTCFTLLCVTTGARNTYRLATRTSALNIYSILLSVGRMMRT